MYFNSIEHYSSASSWWNGTRICNCWRPYCNYGSCFWWGICSLFLAETHSFFHTFLPVLPPSYISSILFSSNNLYTLALFFPGECKSSSFQLFCSFQNLPFQLSAFHLLRLPRLAFFLSIPWRSYSIFIFPIETVSHNCTPLHFGSTFWC